MRQCKNCSSIVTDKLRCPHHHKLRRKILLVEQWKKMMLLLNMGNPKYRKHKEFFDEILFVQDIDIALFYKKVHPILACQRLDKITYDKFFDLVKSLVWNQS